MSTVLVTGGRDYQNENRVYVVLDAAVHRLGLTELIHGDATGADELAQRWAADRRIAQRKFPAASEDLSHPDAEIWQRAGGGQHDRNAGKRRNQQMLDQGKPTIVIAFPGGAGTADMVRRARMAGVQLFLIDWDGRARSN